MRSGLIACAEAARLNEFTEGFRAADYEALLKFWPLWAREDQLPPQGAWRNWLILGGRGAGKTRAGAEWVRGVALGANEFGERARQIALIGESLADVREVMIEGVSGLLGVHARWERPQWEPSRRRLEWKNGAVAYAFSADDPESLRGPQFDAAWCDELCKWRRGEAAFDMLQFGLRLGANPRSAITTTPRPVPLLKRLLADSASVVSRAATKANAFQLAPQFLEQMLTRYAGTRLGRQELDGEVIEARADSLFPRERVEKARVETHPPLSRIVVAIDPPASSREGADACGIVAAGCDDEGKVFVLADESASGLSPLQWASRAISLYWRIDADRIVVEVNQGGEMARAVLSETDASVPVSEVRATRGKVLRAEPVAALYEQGRVSHVGSFPLLEDEMADFGADGLSQGRSPDRLDALVWAITSLVLSPRGATPRMRAL
ncbi:MAG: DNA-packaging protein [Xanthobacteraceae bacterium]|nr:DNA-packaging protein [Xanthobacteraceae bacterium]